MSSQRPRVLDDYAPYLHQRMVSWPATALPDRRRSYRLCAERDTASHAGHAASALPVLA